MLFLKALKYVGKHDDFEIKKRIGASVVTDSSKKYSSAIIKPSDDHSSIMYYFYGTQCHQHLNPAYNTNLVVIYIIQGFFFCLFLEEHRATTVI